MKTDDIGDISELKIISRLVELGHTVSIPYGKNQRYDLVVDVDGQLLRAQCKTGRLREGVIKFKVHSHSTYAGTKDYKGQVEWFLVYCPETDIVYRIMESEVGSSAVYLRIGVPKTNHSSIRWAKDYIL